MLRDTTSRGLYVRFWPPHTSERRGGGGGCEQEGWQGGEGRARISRWAGVARAPSLSHTRNFCPAEAQKKRSHGRVRMNTVNFGSKIGVIFCCTFNLPPWMVVKLTTGDFSGFSADAWFYNTRLKTPPIFRTLVLPHCQFLPQKMLRLHGCCMGRKTGASPVLMLYTGACATLNLKIRLRYIACRILKTQVVAFRDRTTTFKRGLF